MADPISLDGMSSDERQELKEAVCDAVLERTRRVVSGDGAYGAVIVGAKPSYKLSSGFILPRNNQNNDDESNDIRIPSHGLDFRVRAGTHGVLRVTPTLSVYLRGLPTSDELFARDGWLIPRADFSDAGRDQIKNAINQRATAEIPPDTLTMRKAQLRAEISRAVHIALGVVVPERAILPAGDDRTVDDAGGEIDSTPPTTGRLRIPDHLSRRYETPLKWIRVSVEAPILELPLPCDPAAWERIAATYSATLCVSIHDACRLWLASPEGVESAWRRRRPASESFWDQEGWERFLAAARADAPVYGDVVPVFDVQILVQPVPDPLEAGSHSVRIAIENLRDDNERMECGLFNVSIRLELPENALGPLRLERVKRSYHLAGFMTMPAIGVNGGVVDLDASADIRALRTTWMPRYVLPRTAATEIPSVPSSYAALAAETTNVADLFALTDAMDAWIAQVAALTEIVQPGEEGTEADEVFQRTRFEADLASWRREKDRIRKGLDLLERSYRSFQAVPTAAEAFPYRAWLLLNRTFARANPERPGVRPGWRLFQLAFIVAHIPTLASRVDEFASDFDAEFDEESASLLYMATGGGKTEAFFGVLTFALFLDRLRGKYRGVTAMMHYPLRLLTVQQAQRLARLLAHAEIVRRRSSLDGASFEIGFWVGGSNTPNSTQRGTSIAEPLRCIPTWNSARAESEDRLLSSSEPEDRAYAVAKQSWNKLPICPFCNHIDGTTLRLFPEREHRLGIVCDNLRCDWNREHPGRNRAPEPLPFLLVDTDIYRAAPSILLGTIDKLALLGQNTNTIDKIGGMFGMARLLQGGPNGLFHMADGTAASAEPPQDFERVRPSYSDGVEAFFDPFPSIIVQDEMHLLEVSLGTFGGIFETTLFAWLRRLAPLLGDRVRRFPDDQNIPRLPHVIGATATAADVAKHTGALYQKRVVQFPHPGPSLHGGFYTRMAAFTPGGEAERARSSAGTSPAGREAAAPWGRIYASLMTNGRLHTVTTLSVLAAHATTITRWQRDLSAADPVRNARAATEIESCTSDARWSDRRRGAIAAAAAARRYDRLNDLVDLHRIELTYVTNKKGGDQILSALESELQEAHAAMGDDYAVEAFAMELISGGVDIGGIQSVIRRAEEPFDPKADEIATALRGIVATSAISHGVDVESFNAMAFAGMPSDIAEYIQASSRVGRTHVGFSLLIPTPQTRRDRFVVEVHESFHRLLERMISPPAVERWADKAIGRTIPSLVQTWVAGVRHNEAFVRASEARKSAVLLPTRIDQFARVFNDPAAFADCIAFVASAIGVDAAVAMPNNPAHYAELVRAAAERIEREAESGDFTGSLNDFWNNPLAGLPRPMTSLRDVDAHGTIVGSPRSQLNRRLTSEQVGDAMAVIRNRGVSRRRGRRAAGSELDVETDL